MEKTLFPAKDFPKLHQFPTLKQIKGYINVRVAPMNFFHGMWYKGDDGTWKTYKTNPRNRTTVEQILKEVRTQTTRINVDWIIGDRVVFMDEGNSIDRNNQISKTAGQAVLVEITDVYPVSKKTFNLYEGWDNTVWDNRKDQLEGYTSYKFKILK